jgi:hypothetical protein
MPHLTLLWRGSRDGFGAAEFHRRCDGRANTLTVIVDIDGKVFGGLTPVEWESRDLWKEDDRVWSFLFTLRNPCGVLARKFALRVKKKQYAIFSDVRTSPETVEHLATAVRLLFMIPGAASPRPFTMLAVVTLRGQPDSLIVGVFPALLKEFCAKRFELLWRDSDGSFGAAATAARTL